jgi:hypothetical protein
LSFILSFLFPWAPALRKPSILVINWVSSCLSWAPALLLHIFSLLLPRNFFSQIPQVGILARILSSN